MTPPRSVDRPSARMAAEMSAFRMRLPTISPVAKTSPVVSTIVTAMTMAIETIAPAAKVGVPK